MTGDPVSGGWNFYSLAVSDALQDYPKFGVWPDGLYMSANMFQFAAGGPSRRPRVGPQPGPDGSRGAIGAVQELQRSDRSGRAIGTNIAFSVLPSNARVQTGAPPNGSPNYFTGWP